MRSFRKYFIGVVIGSLIGLWIGVNIGAERPLWSNPFVKKSLGQKAKSVATDAWKDAKKAARDQLKD